MRIVLRRQQVVIATKIIDVMFVAAVFFGLPEIRDAFKLGKFALNKVVIKLVHEELPRSFAVVDSFGFIWGGGHAKRDSILEHLVKLTRQKVAVEQKGFDIGKKLAAIAGFSKTMS